MLAGHDFFTVEVLAWRGWVTYYVCSSFIWRVTVSAWQGSRAILTWGFLDQRQYVLQDRDSKFCSLFRAMLKAGGIKPIPLPPRSPNLNAYAERWV